MEHYLLLGLVALVIGLLLMSVGPRVATTTDIGGNDLLAPTSKNGFTTKSKSRKTKSARRG